MPNVSFSSPKLMAPPPSFYLFDPLKTSQQFRLLVPTSQLEVFLGHINERLGIALCIPPGPPSHRFRMKFGHGGTPRPRYFKRTNKEMLSFEDRPLASLEDVEAFNAAGAAHQDTWKLRWNLMKMVDEEKKRAAKERAQRKALARENMLKDTQGLLGLLQYPPDKNAVFICIDAEALEHAPHPVSEIGIAILDLNDIIDVDPGPCGRNWWPLIECQHLRTWEYANLRNHRFIKGCPDAFDFG